ncbi:cupin domain-containing protein [Primorskyibacter sp. 2E233]|uniref:cupin domain-containing protein n=1 Tax=Primorskyibacter sp. 2E233 TaxID=3413431 RepID=UPI003BF38AF5
MDLQMAEALGAALVKMPVIANADHAPLEGGEDPAFGTVRWRTLFDAERNGTRDMVLGVAEFGAFGTLKAHRHAQAEIYFGLAGSGIVTIDGVAHDLQPNVALYVPADAEHYTVAGEDGLRFLYVFPSDRFADVTYRFSPE